MNRREMILLPGAAMAVGQGLAEAATSKTSLRAGTRQVSHKNLLKYSRAKSGYKVPKNTAKVSKYLNFLTTFLTLTPDQQSRAGEIFSAAASTRGNVRSDLKNARQALNDAVINNGAADIAQAAVSIGNLKAQYFSAGALANAAFYQILTTDQQSKLAQFHS